MSIEKVIVEEKQGLSLVTENINGNSKKLFIESYGCQMNMNDSEIVASILAKEDLTQQMNYLTPIWY